MNQKNLVFSQEKIFVNATNQVQGAKKKEKRKWNRLELSLLRKVGADIPDNKTLGQI